MPLLGGTFQQLAQERGTTVEELQRLNPNLRADTTYTVGEVNFGTSPEVTQTLIGEGIGPAIAPSPSGGTGGNITGYTRKGNDVYDAQGNYISFAKAQELGIVDQLVNIPQQLPPTPADKLKDEGAATTGELPDERDKFFKDW